MFPLLGAAALFIALLFLLAVTVFRRYLAPTTGLEGGLDGFRPFNAEFYRPMERLLHEEDLTFLRSQAGYTQPVEDKLRRARKQVYRAYLGHLRADFTGLHRAARYLLAHSNHDRPDLASALIRQSFHFWTRMAWAMVCLELSDLAAVRRMLDPGSLLSGPAWMQDQLRGFAAMPAAA